MKKSFKALNLHDYSEAINFTFSPPNKCPSCGVSPHKDEMFAFYFPSSKFQNCVEIFVIFYCTACDSAYIAQYLANEGYNHIFSIIHDSPMSIYPYSSHQLNFSDNIKLLSKQFTGIYKQSTTAEELGLNEICGIGYRKALEFLIKDYSISLNPDEKEKISKMLLSQVITEYIDNKRIKSLAKASAWTGNDETHYVKKYQDYNISHLKSFIHAVVSFIDSDIEAIKADELINSPKDN